MALPEVHKLLADWQHRPLGSLRENLDRYLGIRIPGCHLKLQPLPQVPEISLHLINDDYPRGRLAPEQAAALMDNPPYWGFCWGSGQALARWILDNPDAVRGSAVVDLGCGSGVAGIAAKMAGARRVILCDTDPLALAAARLNAVRNGVEVTLADSLESPSVSALCRNPAPTVATVADVFYDRDNLPLLPALMTRFDTIVVADSRLKGEALPDMEVFARSESHTVPNLDESPEFNHIALYRPADRQHDKVTYGRVNRSLTPITSG